jgi:uncharacterized iron-regulated membrane protein
MQLDCNWLYCMSSFNSSFARIAFWLHTTLGLGLGLLLLALGVSGSVLIYRQSLERLWYPQFYAISRLSGAVRLDAAVLAGTQAASGQLASIRVPASPSDPLELLIRLERGGSLRVYVDPYSARVLGTRTNDWILAMHSFHHDLFVPGPGRTLLGWLGFGWMLLGLSGIVTVWRRRDSFLRAFRDPWSTRSLHYLVGTFMLPLIIVIGFTATAFTWGRQYTSALRTVLRQPAAQPLPRIEPTSGQASFDQLLLAAKSAVPGAIPTLIRLPAKATDPVSVRLAAEGDLRRIGHSQVWLHPATAQVLRIAARDQRTLDARISDSFFPLHTGEFGGQVIRFIWFLSGFAPGLLFVSGFAVWIRRLWPKKWPAASVSVPQTSISEGELA